VKLNKKFDGTVGGMLCFTGLIVALSVGATWAFLRASEWNVSDAIASDLSKNAALDASDRQELSDLRTKVAEQEQAAAEEKAAYEKEIADADSEDAESVDQLKKRLSGAQARNKKLSDALAALTSDTNSIKVPTGEARFIADDHVAVGVESVSVSFATVKIGDYSSIDMYPGESRAVQLGDKNFVVTLMKIETTGCVFAVRKG
jgi:hypothetical protein